MKVRRATRQDRSEWLRMRRSLWPDGALEHAAEIEQFFTAARTDRETFVAEREGGRLAGFLEADIRPYAEGCSSSRVGYVEGWWVDADVRGQKLGAALMAAAEDWARSLGLVELASDAELGNERGQASHRALGFREVSRIVCFRKLI